MKKPRVLLWIIPIMVVAFLAVAGSQAQIGDAGGVREEKKTFTIFRLKHTTATEVANKLREILGTVGSRNAPPLREMRIVPDERANAILLYASEADHQVVQAILQTLDQAQSLRDDQSIKQVDLVPLTSISPGPQLEKALRLIYQDQGQFALDKEKRLAVLAGDRQTREQAMRLLRGMEETQAAREKTGSFRVRVVWLISGLKREDAPAVPADLTEAVAELRRLGVDKLELAAQVLATAPLEAPFQIEGSARIPIPTRLSVMGTLTPRGTGVGLEVQINATREEVGRGANFGGSPRSDKICSLQTQITTPLGHAVVLGVTPTDGMPSVFVVQVLREDKKEQRRP